MSFKHFHLPEAVIYAEQESFQGIDDAFLSKLKADCENWSRRLAEFKSDLFTMAAITEFNVLTRKDCADVAAVHDRLESEIGQRGTVGNKAAFEF